MADTYWGFQRPYAHRTVPPTWSRQNGFHFYELQGIHSKSHFFNEQVGNTMGAPSRPIGDKTNDVMKARDDPILERPQSRRFCMATYGLQQRQDWGTQLRNPRPQSASAAPLSRTTQKTFAEFSEQVRNCDRLMVNPGGTTSKRASTPQAGKRGMKRELSEDKLKKLLGQRGLQNLERKVQMNKTF